MKTLKSKLLIVLLAAMFLSFAGFAATHAFVNAEGEKTFAIESVEFYTRQTYNYLGASNTVTGQRTEYLIRLQAQDDVLSAYDFNQQLSVSDFDSKVIANETALSGVTGGYKLLKHDENCLRLVLNRPLGYIGFTFQSGLTIGEYSSASEAKFYQNVDGSFATEEPEYRVNAVYCGPVGAHANFILVQIAMTKANAVNQDGVNSILLNGKALSEYGSSDVVQWNDGGVLKPNYSNDWDTGWAQYHFRVYLSVALMNGGVTMTFPKGFSTGGAYTTEEEQTFSLPAGSYGSWNNLHTFNYITGNEKSYSIESVAMTARQTHQDASVGYIRTEYTFKLNAAEDVLGNYEDGEEISLPEFSINAKVNDISMNGVNDGVTKYAPFRFYKDGVNSLKVVLGRALGYVSFTIPKNLRIGNCLLSDETATYYQNVDGSFSTVSPEYRVNGVYQVPVGGHANNVIEMIQIAVTKSGEANGTGIAGIKLNGKALAEYSSTEVEFYGAEPNWSIDYDNGYAGYHFRIFVSNDVLKNGAVISFPKGWSANGADATGLTEEQVFCIPAGVTGDYYRQATWSVPEATYTDGTTVTEGVPSYDSENNEFTYTLDSSKFDQGNKKLVGWTVEDGDKKFVKDGEYKSQSGVLTFNAVYLDFATRGGAYIKVNSAEDSGLRWMTDVNKTDYEALTAIAAETGATVEFGTELTTDKLTTALKIVTERWGDTGEDTKTFNGVLTDLASDYYSWEFVAKGYVKVTYSDGTESVIYASYTEELVKRSIKIVASSALADVRDEEEGAYVYPTEDGKYSAYTEEQRNILSQIAK